MGQKVHSMKTRGEVGSKIQEFLKSIPVYSELSESSAIVLSRACRFQQIKKVRFFSFNQTHPNWPNIVRSGIISIVLNSPNGRDMVINEMRAGDTFGELGILTKQPRSTSAMARVDSELLVIPCQVFYVLLRMSHNWRVTCWILPPAVYRGLASVRRLGIFRCASAFSASAFGSG